MKVEPVDDNKEAFIPAGDNAQLSMAELKTRLENCVINGQVTNEGAKAAFDDFSKENNTAGLLSFVVNLEAKAKVAPREVVEKAFENKDNLEPITNDETLARKVVRPKNDTDEDDRNWAKLFAEYNGAVVEPPSMSNTVATDIFSVIDVPSQCVFYDTEQVRARKLGFKHMSKLHALLSNKNPFLLIDAISTTVDYDIQKLTQGDLTYLLYWLRSASLPKSPMKVNWISRYGTTESMTVDSSKLTEIRVPLTEELREKFEYYKGLGFDMPRVYDILAISKFDMGDCPDIDQWAYEQSQFFKPLPGETIGQRFRRISDLMDDSIELLEELKEFKRDFAHGVNETIEVQVDLKKFNPHDAIRSLNGAADRSEASMYRYGFDPTLLEIIQDYRKEVLEIEERIEKGESVIPRVESVEVNIDALSFFQAIQD